MIYHSVLVCVLNVIELLRVRGIDQTPTHPLAPPASCSTLRIVFCLHLSVTLFYMRLCVDRSPPSISVCFIFISLLSLPSFTPLSLLSLTEREIININVSLLFSPSFTFLSFFYYRSLFCSTIYTSLWVFIPHHCFHSTFPPSVSSLSLSLFSLFSALCSCSVFIYNCSVDNSLLCLQPYSHLSD